MLNSLIRGVGMGAGMGIGQEITSTVIQHVRNRRQGNNAPNNNVAADWDIKCACGETNTADSRFCGQCGKTLVARCNLTAGTKCTCGFMNATGQKFCSECGTRLG